MKSILKKDKRFWKEFNAELIKIIKIIKIIKSMIKGCKILSYEERLRQCGSTALEKWRVRGEVIESYKQKNLQKVPGAHSRQCIKAPLFPYELLTNKVEVPHDKFSPSAVYCYSRT